MATEAENVDAQIGEIIQGITRHLNCFTEENRNLRKRAIEGVIKEVLGKKPTVEAQVLQGVISVVLKSVLKLVSDPVEKCRERSITFLNECFQKIPEPVSVLHYVMPVMVQRLGQQNITEPSEEIRLQLVDMILNLVNLTEQGMAPFVDDMVTILQRTILDPYPEVKKKSCQCACHLARAVPQHFHMQSESLVEPLLLAVSHQHSRVRVEVVLAIGDVIQYGSNKPVPDIVSHLAQRLFDNVPAVRKAVIQVVGNWLLDMYDRYSFFPKLLPLLLTGITDELPDIQSQAEAMWHDVGLKYEAENENDLKDKQDFAKQDPDHYPPGVERPNLGCRTLMYHNFSKILGGLVNDITDWVVQTRIKSAHLMYTMLLNEEDNVTQHLPKVLSGLYRACSDEEQEVVNYVKKSAELVGYFVSPEIWCKMILQQVKLTQSAGPLLILSATIRASERAALKGYLEDICSVLTDPLLCWVADSSLQVQLLSCVESILKTCQSDCVDIGYDLFYILLSVLSLHRSDVIKDESHRLLEGLASSQNLDSVQELYNGHTKTVISSLNEGYEQWTQHSNERVVLDTLILEGGPVVGELLEDIIPIMVANLHPDKDPEVRLKFFSLLSRLMLNAPQTIDSQQRFGEFAVTVVKDMVLPNCVWKAGRVATAIRTMAVSCLWALMQSGILDADRLLVVMEDLVTQLLSTLEDDAKDTRLVSCRVLTKVFTTVGTRLDQDKLHNIYPDLLKRLDDSSNDIRIAMCTTFQAYFECFADSYEVSLYRAHLEAQYKGLLVHMDDPDVTIQEAVLDVLKTAARFSPDMLLKEVDSVKHKHRSTKFCDQLQECIHHLPKPE